jgi:hypothetical protein
MCNGTTFLTNVTLLDEYKGQSIPDNMLVYVYN